MNFNKQEKYFIVALNEYSNLLYHFKEEHYDYDIQIISKNELLNLLSFSYQKDPISYLLSYEKYDYSTIKKILNILRIGNFEEIKEFKDIYDDLLDNGYIKIDDLGEMKVSQRKVLLFESEEDFELKQFLIRKHIQFDFLTFNDIGRNPVYSKNNGPKIYNFDNKFLQFFYIFSDIRKEVVDHPEKKDSITLFIKDNKDLFYVNFFSELFNLPVFTRIKMPMITDKDVSKAIKSFYENKNFVIEGEVKTGTSLEILKNTIEEYNLQNLSDFGFAYSSLMEILQSKTYEYTYQDRGIGLTNEIFFDSTFDDDHIIYVTDFEFGEFYKEFDDNNVLSDAELEKIGVNPSYIKTRMDRKLRLNFLMYHRFNLLSRVLLHLKDKIYSSQFEKEMGWKSIKPDYKHNQEGVYTKEALKMMDAYYKDAGHFKADNEYRNYQHKVDEIKNVTKKDEFSVTSFDAFFKCPYYYYLDNIVNLSRNDKNQDYVARNRGTLIHKVFEDIYTRDYSDFDKAYDESFALGIEAYKENNPSELTVEEQAYIEFIHKWLKDIVKEVIKQKDYSNIVSENAEEKINFTIPNTNYKITGKIDKIVHTVGQSGQKYYTIIDYKTGKSGTFEIDKCFLGGSLQLPLYELGLKDKANKHLTSNGTEDYGGFGIQHIYFPKDVPIDSKESSYNEKTIIQNIKIEGIAFSDKDYFYSFDQSVLNISKRSKQGTFLSVRYTFTNNDCIVARVGKHDYSYAEFKYDVVSAAIDSIEKINANDFKIAPTVDKSSYYGKEYCAYCKYKNICYHSKEDVVDISKKIALKFSSEASGNSEYNSSESEGEDYE